MFALFYVTAIVLQHIFYLKAHEIKYKFFLANFSFVFFLAGNLFLLTAIHYLLKQKKDIYYWGLIVYVIISFFLNAGPYRWGWLAGGVLAQILIQFNILRISLLALRRKRRGTLIIVAGAILYSICFLIFLAQGKLVNSDFFLTISTLPTVLFNITQLSIPMAASIYLGLEFAFVNDSLQQKLKEVNDLSEKNLAQEREKQQFLASQNETLERQVGERTSELSRSLKELKETQTQLIQSEKMASLGELTAGIAHEIQNPLNFVNNFSDVNRELIEDMKQEIDKGNFTEVKAIANDVIDNEQKINHHGKRADTIVKGMLQHSRSNTNQKEPTDINKLADEYLRLCYHGLRAKDQFFNATIQTDFDQSLDKINIIPQDIGRVLLNLYTNAFYAVSEKKKEQPEARLNDEVGQGYEPTVSVTTKRISDKVEIKVADNGNGIPQQAVDKIFQPFFTTKPTGQGTGLGLSLSYDIITKAHGGEIKVETKENEYTEFIIQLPAN
jgi:signal transduction histidine kinase